MYKVCLEESTGKYVGMLDGKVVSRASTREKVVAALQRKGLSVAEGEPVACEAKPKEYFTVAERFEFIAQFVDMIRRRVIPSLIITGEGGIGKSHAVVKALIAKGMQEEGIGDYVPDAKKAFIVFKGFSTAKALYRNLFENNGKVIIFDDADSVFKDVIAANLLKAALDSNEKRVVSWGAETDDGLPTRFEFTGRVIFVSNLSQSKFPQALLSRSLRVDLTLNQDEKLERIEHVFKEEIADPTEMNAVMGFIKKNAGSFTDLNLRSAMNVLKLHRDAGDGWERLALYTVCA